MRTILITSILCFLLLNCGCNFSPSQLSPEDILSNKGITLPPVAKPVAAYVNTVQTGKLVFTSGNLPMKDGKIVYQGKVGSDIDLQTAQQAAELCAVNALAALKSHLGSLQKIKRIIRVEVFVNSDNGFTDQSLVANGASNLLQDIFGPSGKHTRMAIGAAQLPLNSAVEVALTIERK